MADVIRPGREARGDAYRESSRDAAHDGVRPSGRAERERERRLASAGVDATAHERLDELSRLESGSSLTRHTPRRRAFAGPLLPMRDAGVVAAKRRASNAVPNLLIAICVAVTVTVGAALAWHMWGLERDAAGLRGVAAAYAATGHAAGDDSMLPPLVDFDALRAVNPEVSGWIYIPGTSVNYPVLSSPERDKYLRRDLWGDRSVAGSIFTDSGNSGDIAADRHVVLYGHHLPSRTMFTPVSSYLDDAAFYDSHRLAYVETPGVTYELRVVGAYKVAPGESGEVATTFAGDGDFRRFADTRFASAASRGRASDDFDRSRVGKLFTLVTCTDDGRARTIVTCVPVRKFPTSEIPSMRSRAGVEDGVARVGYRREAVRDAGRREAGRDGGVIGAFLDRVYELLAGMAGL